MEVRPTKNIAKQDETFNAFYKSLEGYLLNASSQVSQSKTLFNIGVYDDIFKLIEKAHKDPLGIISDKIESEVKGIHTILDGMVNAFLSTNESLIKCFQKVDHSNNALYYYIVLKEDTLTNRKPFLRFIFDYDNKPISKKFPIIFDFVSIEIFDELLNEYETA